MAPVAERPDARALLEAARSVVVGDLLPRLDGEARLDALMVAKALSIATRELAAGTPEVRLPGGEAIDAAQWRERLRAGAEPDTDGALREALLALTRARLRISNPKMLATLESLYAEPEE